MYHPTVGRFLQRDPSGYADGMSLYQYVASDPMSSLDPFGLWEVKRESLAYAPALAEPDDTVEDLANLIGLNPGEWQKWLKWTEWPEHLSVGGWRVDEGKWRQLGARVGDPFTSNYIPPQNEKEKMTGCEWFWIPNTVFAYWAGELAGLGKWWVMWGMDVGTLKKRGFDVQEHEGWTAKVLEAEIQTAMMAKELHGIFFWGHGSPGFVYTTAKAFHKRDQAYYSYYHNWHPHYHMGLGVLWACYSDTARGAFSTSANAIFRGHTGTLWPHGLHLYGPSISELIPPGKQGTKK
jgi:hypothetical protein